MVNKSSLRVAATVVAIACASTAHAQRADTLGAPPEAVAQVMFEDPQGSREQPLEPVRLAAATRAVAPPLPARLSDMARWTPLLLVFGVLALIGGYLLMTRRRLRRAPWESDETEASTARGREERFAEELKALWDKTTTTETLRPVTRSSRRSAKQNIDWKQTLVTSSLEGSKISKIKTSDGESR